jgi:hypothetical protein
MYESVLVEVAKRLPVSALRKFAQTNDMCKEAAREAWETWRGACAAISAGRMFSDKCWMDTYTRTCRQRAFRFTDGSKAWTTLSTTPLWLWVRLQPYMHAAIKPADVSLRVKADCSVLHMTCMRNGMPWTTLSSAGAYWRFTDSIPDMDNQAGIAKVLKALLGMLAVRRHADKNVYKLHHHYHPCKINMKKSKMDGTRRHGHFPKPSTGRAFATTVVL